MKEPYLFITIHATIYLRLLYYFYELIFETMRDFLGANNRFTTAYHLIFPN